MQRYGLIGAGHRAQMYTDAIGGAHSDVATLVAFADTNPGRMAYHADRMASEYGYAPDAGSDEARLNDYLHPRDWLREAAATP